MTETSDVITEKEFQQTVVELARTLGYLVGFTHDSRKSEPGEPDLRMVKAPHWEGPVLHAGRVIFAELKTEKGTYTKGRWNKAHTRWLPGQDEWAEALKGCEGVEYYLVRPRDIDWFEKVLQGGKP